MSKIKNHQNHCQQYIINALTIFILKVIYITINKLFNVDVKSSAISQLTIYNWIFFKCIKL